jgi:hypothetical protein
MMDKRIRGGYGMRSIFLLLIAMALVMCSAFFSGCEKTTSEPPQGIGEQELYAFSPDRQHFLSNAQPFPLPPGISRKDALDRLGSHLAETYFRSTYTEEITEICFDVTVIDAIGNPSRPLQIATVNMLDPGGYAMKYFFQGSGGAQTTFYILAATFMQPHLDPPLIDGLVLLYNGLMLPELDHINLRGILTPRLVRRVAMRAIVASRR